MSGGSFEEISMDFQQCLHRMHSNWQLAPELMWEQDLPKVSPKNDREKKLVDMAKAANIGITNVLIDCASSLRRPTHAAYAVPCITPTHAIYSTELGRYLSTTDLLNAQGFWKSCFSPSTYQHLLSNPELAQDIVGNAFSSTVFQAVFIASLASAPDAWSTLPGTGSGDTAMEPALCQAFGVRRRVRSKRPAPEYDSAKGSLVKPRKKSSRQKQSGPKKKSKRQIYKRKKKNVDSRKYSKGKRDEATIWDKEQV